MNYQTKPEDGLSIAKEALQLSSRIGLPLIPEVFEILYRYVEGNDHQLRKHIEYLLHDAGAMDLEKTLTLHRQYCVQQDVATERIGSQLIGEMKSFRSLVNEQEVAGSAFGESIEIAGQLFDKSSPSEQEIKSCIHALAESNLQMSRKLHSAESKLIDTQKRVEKMQADLQDTQRSMMLDPLTKVGNRRYFDTACQHVIANFDHSGFSAYLALIDLDYFKEVNDTFGHPAGDQVMIFFAERLKTCYPNIAIARIGGDEFAAILTNHSRDEAIEFSEELRAYFSSHPIKVVSTDDVIDRISFSIGVAKFRSKDDSSSVYARADKLLYEAKRLGRNRAIVERG